MNEKLTEDFQTEHGITLPKDYVVFLEHGAGRKLNGKCFSISEDEGESTLQYFYSLGDIESYLDLKEAFTVFKGRVPSNMMPIAIDTTGNQICIIINDAEVSHVYYWDHEHEGSEKALTRISKSLGQFLSSLYDGSSICFDDVDEYINDGELNDFICLVHKGFDIESLNSNGRSVLERATTKNRLDLVKYLISIGANLRSAPEIAQKNYKFFPEFEPMVRYFKGIKK
ncbi:hypothetical protein N474_25645 [Pseudoalteromonas luteoviolacea CPMOR-2]|uniref:SMI1/KNR4 family protein n=1 Tax=Pseudoalteromonas luteoviolacea TaxID=43657 RepID=UPI0007B05A01|nr:SMI1/KNR4 family protein [Pseudoalteromonas luteoviolacea]KZN57925.1 hypothetical protein N474_25645 [Pseudoalteromonas luteoviolacea CPMOR-2]